MLINRLNLENFRNYNKKEFEFSPETTIIVGPNAAGKSNLMEAIFLLAFGSSPRADLDREMIRSVISDKGEVISEEPGSGRMAFVRGQIHGSDPKYLEVVLTETGKKFRVNGVARRKQDFTPHLHAVLFSPEDLNLVTGSPDLRRRFLDFALSSVDSVYDRAATAYDQVRKRRNRLLEQIHQEGGSLPAAGRENELGFWDAKLLEHGVLLQDKHKEFFNELNSQLATRNLLLEYHPSGLTAERLLEFRPREIAAETSLIGPHRDDFGFLVHGSEFVDGDKDLAAYGSRGEQRKAVLALKKAELEFVERKIGSRPVLLLDDIFSELDPENRAGVFDLISDGQTIITTTDLYYIPEKIQEDLQIIKL